jgi:hypothetical protein
MEAVNAQPMSEESEGRCCTYHATSEAPTMKHVAVRWLVAGGFTAALAFTSLAAADAAEPALMTLESVVSRLMPGVVPESIVISPNRQRVAFFASGDGKWRAVVDGVESKEYKAMVKMKPVFSPDSARLAYVAARDASKFVVLDGVEGKKYDNIGGLTFSADSKRFAYAGQTGDTWRLIVDGLEQKAFDAIGSSGPVFTPDGKRFGYEAKRGEKWLVVVDATEGREYDGVMSLRFSPDGGRFAYMAARGRKMLVVLNAEEGREYDSFLRGSELVFASPFRVEALAVHGSRILSVSLMQSLEGVPPDR